MSHQHHPEEKPDRGVEIDGADTSRVHAQRPRGGYRKDLEVLGGHIRRQCEALNLSTAAAAKKAGVSKRTMIRLMNGEVDPRYSTLRRVSAALHLGIPIRP